MSSEKIKVLTKADLLAKIRETDPDFQPNDPVKINPYNNELQQIPFSDVQPQKIQWLWPERIARGKVSVFAGEPGKGKSQLLLWIGAACTNGAIMPADGFKFPDGKVAILAAEDDDDDTMWPRLKAVDANLSKILQLRSSPKIDENGELQDDMVRLDTDMQKLDNTLTNHPGYVLLIIDPITAYLGNINDYKNSEVRTLMTKLARLAKKHNIAIILNTHLSKPAGNPQSGSIINRVTGSLAYTATARSVYLICDHQDDKKLKLFLPVKNNLGEDTGGYAYRVCPITVRHEGQDYGTCRIEWLSEKVSISANDAMSNTKTSTKLDEAEEFLKECLSPGTMAVRDIRNKAEQLDISPNRLYKARDKLKVIEDYTLDRPRLTTWTLPE